MAMPPPPNRRGPMTGNPVVNRPVTPRTGPMPGPVINRPVSPRTGPMNPGPMPLPPQVNVQPTGPSNPGPMPLPPQVNVQPTGPMNPGPMPPPTGPMNPGPMPPPTGGPMNPGPMPPPTGMGPGMKRGGKVKKMAAGGSTSKASSASKRADGIAQRGKTKCKMY